MNKSFPMKLMGVKSMFTHEITGINFRTFWKKNSAGDSAFVVFVVV